MPQDAALDLLIVTGMSGAGRSTAARALEDIGWFVVDNLPPSLLSQACTVLSGTDVHHLAVVVDVRGGSMFRSLQRELSTLREAGLDIRVLFLEANDESLVRRFESSRRPHPLQGSGRILDGLTREREMLAELRASADLVVDTTNLNVHDLRRKVEAAFDAGDIEPLKATIMSFGFKYGIPVDADIVLDARFLPNPFWVEELRPLSGQDASVSEYVLDSAPAQSFLNEVQALLNTVAEGYGREGKRYVTIAIGCTGGQHRSVAMAIELAERLVREGLPATVVHRDMGRE